MAAADISIDALVSSLKGTTEFNDLKRRLGHLSQGEGPLSTPAARTTDERATRKVHYEEAKEDIAKWLPLVKANREAPHLSFSAEANTVRHVVTVDSMVDSFKPTTPLELEMASAFKQLSGAGAEQTPDGLPADAEVSFEEFCKRQNEMAKLKALMSYHDKKMRHQNKIKSKSYRKIRKKQKERQTAAEAERAQAQGGVAEGELEALARARERITLKHRNKSKWARRVLKRGGSANESHREALNRYVERAQELLQKVDTARESESDDSADGSEDGDGSGDDEEEEEDDDDVGGDGDGEGGIGVRIRRPAPSAASPWRPASGDIAAHLPIPAATTASKPPQSKAPKPQQSLASKPQQSTASKPQQASSAPKAPAGKRGREEGKPAKKEEVGKKAEGQGRQGKQDSLGGKASAAEAPQARGSSAAAGGGQPKKKQQQKKARAEEGTEGEEEDEDELSDDEEHEVAASLTQQELVRRAFAGFGADEREFAQEKEAELAEGLPKPVPELQGWGSWAGIGSEALNAAPVAQAKKKKRGLAAVSATPAALKKPKTSTRKDAALSTVIINEKRDKKFVKFQADTVPYPFTSREQYEFSLRTPLGPEWNASTAFTALNKPEVVTRAGLIIEPIKFKKAKAQGKQGKKQ